MTGKNKIKEKSLVGSMMSFNLTNHRQIILLSVLSLILLSTLAYSASTVTVSTTQAVLVKGSRGKVNIKLDQVPDGVSGYKLEMELKDKSKAEITDVMHKSLGDQRNQKEKLGTDHYSISAIDLPRSVNPGDDNVVITTVEVEGTQKGSTSLELDVKYLDDDDGDAINYEVETESIEVIGEKDWTRLNNDTSGPPQDLNGDGLFEDVTGNGQHSFKDALVLYNELNNRLVQSYDYLFDFNGDGKVGVTDAVALAFL